jgi:hypothetical protein
LNLQIHVNIWTFTKQEALLHLKQLGLLK